MKPVLRLIVLYLKDVSKKNSNQPFCVFFSTVGFSHSAKAKIKNKNHFHGLPKTPQKKKNFLHCNLHKDFLLIKTSICQGTGPGPLE